jgi:molecular chaperone IbpA
MHTFPARKEPAEWPSKYDKTVLPKPATLQSLFNDMFFLGFSDQISRWNTLTQLKPVSFPPYNLIKLDDDSYKVELAVAGYTKDDIAITVERDQLIVASKDQDEKEDNEVIHQGIAQRQWRQKFILGEYMEVASATLRDGLLTINIERNMPEEDKPKVIKIK